MTNTKSTKRALLASVMAMLLCFTMLLGTTFAWFTDSATSANNKIVAGTLDVKLYKYDGTQYVDISTNSDPVVDSTITWEPGRTEVVYLMIKNNGNLALKYTVGLNVQNVSKDLYKAMQYVITPGAQNGSVTSWDATNAKSVVLGTQTVTDAAVEMAPSAEHYFALSIHMDELAGNEYQGGEVNFDLTVLATQDTVESDSFNNQYDKDAVYGDVIVSSDAELKAAIIDPKCKVIAVKGDLTYDWGANSYENSEALYMKGKTFVGFDKNSSITFAGYGSANPITDVTLKNITVKDITVGDNESSWEHGYLEFVSLKAQNVVFADPIMLDGNSKLVNCSMINNASSWYGIWIKGGNTVIEDCTFSGTRSIKIHEANSSDVESVVIDNCKIGALSEKPGVVIGTVNAATTIKITNNVFAATQPGDQNNYKYETDTDVTTFNFVDENNTVYSALITTADQLTEALAAGKDVVLKDNISTEATTTAPYGNKYAFKLDGGVLDGNGNELYMECYGDDYGIMTSGGTVKNITIKKGCRAIMIMYPTKDVILDNVNIGGDGVLYPINTGEAGAKGVDLIVTNSTLAGWTSYSNIASASFTNVKFEQGTYYNNIYGRVLKPYVNTTLTNCSFIEHMNLDLSGLAEGQKVTFVNCTVNGQTVTADVFTIPTDDAQYDTALFTIDLPSWATSIDDCIVFN